MARHFPTSCSARNIPRRSVNAYGWRHAAPCSSRKAASSRHGAHRRYELPMLHAVVPFEPHSNSQSPGQQSSSPSFFFRLSCSLVPIPHPFPSFLVLPLVPLVPFVFKSSSFPFNHQSTILHRSSSFSQATNRRCSALFDYSPLTISFAHVPFEPHSNSQSRSR